MPTEGSRHHGQDVLVLIVLGLRGDLGCGASIACLCGSAALMSMSSGCMSGMQHQNMRSLGRHSQASTARGAVCLASRVEQALHSRSAWLELTWQHSIDAHALGRQLKGEILCQRVLSGLGHIVRGVPSTRHLGANRPNVHHCTLHTCSSWLSSQSRES